MICNKGQASYACFHLNCHEDALDCEYRQLAVEYDLHVRGESSQFWQALIVRLCLLPIVRSRPPHNTVMKEEGHSHDRTPKTEEQGSLLTLTAEPILRADAYCETGSQRSTGTLTKVSVKMEEAKLLQNVECTS